MEGCRSLCDTTILDSTTYRTRKSSQVLEGGVAARRQSGSTEILVDRLAWRR